MGVTTEMARLFLHCFAGCILFFLTFWSLHRPDRTMSFFRHGYGVANKTKGREVSVLVVILACILVVLIFFFFHVFSGEICACVVTFYTQLSLYI